MTEFVCGVLTTVACLCFYVATWAWVHGRQNDEDYETVKKRLGTLVEP